MKTSTNPSFGPALVLHFEGFYQCRLATDPDPTREKRGVSGYTYALPGEDDLDQVINLQGSQIPNQNFRAGLPAYPSLSNFGVTVKQVTYWEPGPPTVARNPGQALVGAKVFLLDNPTYEMRNQIVSDGVQRIAPIINPFNLRIVGANGNIVLERSDPLADDGSNEVSWKLRYDQYQRRIPIYNRPSDEVLEALFSLVPLNPAVPPNTTFNPTQYYQERIQWLQDQINLENSLPIPDPVKISNWTTRKKTIEYYSGTGNPISEGFIEGRMALQTIWQHTLRGVNPIISGERLLDGSIRRGNWETRFWHGGWDGDLMRGYMKGWLAIPFQVAGASSVTSSSLSVKVEVEASGESDPTPTEKLKKKLKSKKKLKQKLKKAKKVHLKGKALTAEKKKMAKKALKKGKAKLKKRK